MSLTISRTGQAAALRSPLARGLLLLALAAGLAAGFLTGGASSVDPDLTRLLRAMAALKLLFVAAAAASMLWRLQAPIRPAPFALYALASFAMGAGPGLIWTLAHVALGAALLHLGLLAALLLMWRDATLRTLLAEAIARRRLKLARAVPASPATATPPGPPANAAAN